MKNIRIVFDLFRIKHWAKNTFIFFPLIFAGLLYDVVKFNRSVLTFVAFCLISSGVYILNDYFDISADRLHPRKSQRPLAQGKIEPYTALIIAFCVTLAGLTLSFNINRSVFLIAIAYIGLHGIYNIWAKKVIMLDVFFVAVGFQLRIWAGSIAVGVIPSEWLQMCVLLIALFLGFVKRRHEIVVLNDKASEHRDVLGHYSAYLLDQVIIVCATLSIVFYGLYAISANIGFGGRNYNTIYSMFFVIYGIFRYLYLVHQKDAGGDAEEVIFSDKPLLITILSWICYVIVVIYSPFGN